MAALRLLESNRDEQIAGHLLRMCRLFLDAA
jgi:hypothetical protein